MQLVGADNKWSYGSDVNKDSTLMYKAKANDTAFKTKANDTALKAKAKATAFKAKAKDTPTQP